MYPKLDHALIKGTLADTPEREELKDYDPSLIKKGGGGNFKFN
jgi:hypothetical protein